MSPIFYLKSETDDFDTADGWTLDWARPIYGYVGGRGNVHKSMKLKAFETF